MDTTASVLVVVGFVAVVGFLIFMGVAVRMILRRLTNVINAVERRDKFTPPIFMPDLKADPLSTSQGKT